MSNLEALLRKSVVSGFFIASTFILSKGLLGFLNKSCDYLTGTFVITDCYKVFFSIFLAVLGYEDFIV